MSDYGFEVYTQTGDLAASSDYSCLYPLTPPTILVDQINTSNGLYYRRIATNYPNTMNPPALGIQMNPGDQVGVFSVEVVNLVINSVNTPVWQYLICGKDYGSVGLGYDKFIWYDRLALGSTPASGDYGLVVRDNSSEIMFDSNRKPFWMGDILFHTGPTVLNKGSSAPYYSGLSIPLTQPTPPNTGYPYTNLVLIGTISSWHTVTTSVPFVMCPHYRSDGTAVDFTPWRSAGYDFSAGPSTITVRQFMTIAGDVPP